MTVAGSLAVAPSFVAKSTVKFVTSPISGTMVTAPLVPATRNRPPVTVSTVTESLLLGVTTVNVVTPSTSIVLAVSNSLKEIVVAADCDLTAIRCHAVDADRYSTVRRVGARRSAVAVNDQLICACQSSNGDRHAQRGIDNDPIVIETALD